MTPMPSLVDHVLALVLVIVLPLWGARAYRHLERALARGRPDARLHAYQESMAVLWGLAAGLLAWWLLAGRAMGGLGLGAGGGRAMPWVVGGAVAFVVVSLAQLRAVRRSEELRTQVRAQLRSIGAFLPHDRREGRWFAALGITAGVCEELLYRGFLIAYIAAFTGVWWAALLAGVAFGLGHLYQGGGGVLKTAAVGLVLGLATVATGSIWIPILLHATVDVVNGAMARLVFEEGHA